MTPRLFKSNVELGNYFEGIAKQAKNPKAVANWVINNLLAKLAEAADVSDSIRSTRALEPTHV